MQKRYSVLLLYPDYVAEQYGEEIFYNFVKADSVSMAIKQAQRNAFESNELVIGDDGELEDFAVLLVIEGHHKDLSCIDEEMNKA